MLWHRLISPGFNSLIPQKGTRFRLNQGFRRGGALIHSPPEGMRHWGLAYFRACQRSFNSLTSQKEMRQQDDRPVVRVLHAL